MAEISILIKAQADVEAAFGQLKSALGDIDSAVQQANGGLVNTAAASKGAEAGLKGTGGGAKEASGLLGDLSGVLGKVDGGMGSLASSASQLIGSGGGEMGLLGIAGAAAAAVGALVALGMAGGSLETELAQLSATTGLNIERTDFWSHALGDAGGNAGSLTMMSRLLSNQIDGISQSFENGSPLTQKAGALYDALGGSILNAKGNILSGGEAIEILIPKLAALSDADERSRIGTELFGKSWGAVSLLVADWPRIAAAAQAQTDETSAALANAGMNAGDYNKAMEDIKTHMQVLEIEALPPVITLLQSVAHILQTIIGIGSIDIHFNVLGLSTGSLGSVAGQANKALEMFVPGLGPIESLAGLLGGGGGGSGGGSNSPDPTRPAQFGQGSDQMGKDNWAATYNQGLKDAEAQKKADAEAEKKRLADIAAAKRASDAAIAEGERAAAAAVAEAEAHLHAIQSALKDGTISYAESISLNLSPAMAAHLEVLDSVKSHTDAANDAYYQQVKAVDGMVESLKMGQSAFTDFSLHLTADALKLTQSALGGVLGQNTQEMARLNLQQAQAQSRADSTTGTAHEAAQRDLAAINARIKAETDHVSILKASGEVSNKLLLTDKERDRVAGQLIKDELNQSTALVAMDSDIKFKVIPGFTAATDAANALASALNAAARAGGGSSGPSRSTSAPSQSVTNNLRSQGFAVGP